MTDDELSNDPTHKLQAALNHDRQDADMNLPAAYLVACRRWYVGLSGSQRVVVILAGAAFAKGNEAAAEKIAAELPPAPVCPLL